MKYLSSKIISKKILLQNYKVLKAISGKNICAVLKANAYGHNSKNVCKILSEVCDFFAVENLYEALEIRKVNKTANILVLGYCNDYKLASKNNIFVMIDSVKELQKIKKINISLGVHIKINSGMNRLGVKTKNEFSKMIKLIKNSKKIELKGVFTHIFDSKNKKTTQKQIFIFKRFINLVPANLSPTIHIGGSNLVNYNIDFVDYIRCGISLYGYMQKNTFPCMKIKSKVVKISKVKKGEYVGYDCYFKTTKDIKVAVVPIGYADGIIRQFQKDMNVYFKGKKLKVIGKICMDMLMIDVSKVDIKLGDWVTVFNNAKYWSKKSGLSEYEILTGLNKARTNIIVV